jgi:hypothetical protein
VGTPTSNLAFELNHDAPSGTVHGADSKPHYHDPEQHKPPGAAHYPSAAVPDSEPNRTPAAGEYPAALQHCVALCAAVPQHDWISEQQLLPSPGTAQFFIACANTKAGSNAERKLDSDLLQSPTVVQLNAFLFRAAAVLQFVTGLLCPSALRELHADPVLQRADSFDAIANLLCSTAVVQLAFFIAFELCPQQWR